MQRENSIERVIETLEWLCSVHGCYVPMKYQNEGNVSVLKREKIPINQSCFSLAFDMEFMLK